MSNQSKHVEKPAGRRFARPKNTAVYMDTHITKLWDFVKNDPTFPAAIRPSSRITLFDLDEIDTWLDSKRSK